MPVGISGIFFWSSDTDLMSESHFFLFSNATSSLKTEGI